MAQAAARRYVIAVTALAGVLQVGSGAWAFFAPRSFYQTIATFPPYHVHFLHDIGAFLLGIGVALLLALVWRDGLFVVLLGATVAATAHWVSHVRDHDLGGAASDPWLLGAFALLLLVALGLRFPARHGPARHGPAGYGPAEHGQVEQPDWAAER